MGLMAHEAAHVVVRRYRRPWFWLVVLFVAALAATFLVITNARSRIAQNDEQFAVGQRLRIQTVEQHVDEYFGVATQLAAAGAKLFDNSHGDRRLTQRLLLSLYQSRQNRMVYGVGAFYAPYAFDPKSRLISFYDHSNAPLPPGGGSVERGAYDRTLPGDVDEVAYDSEGDETPIDYTGKSWYLAALATPEYVAFDGPYTDSKRSFISTLKAIGHTGKVSGVVSVDTLTVFFQTLMLGPLVRGDIAYVASGRHHRWLVGTVPKLPSDLSPYIDMQVPLHLTKATLHLFADATELRAADRRISFGSVVQSAVVWLIAGLFGFGMTRNWRSHEARLQLEAEQTSLEREIDVRKTIETELRKAAYTDALTGLPNRAALLEAASAAIAVTSGEPTHALFFIDLDRFNMINDTLGHLAGDELLKMIAVRLRDSLPLNATIARLGGDEFVVCATVLPEDAGAFGERILTCLRQPMLLAGRACYTAASIGVVIVDVAYRSPEELLRDADIAMYAAKANGRACYAIFDTKMRSKVAAESDLENALRRAIERREFVPYYQPIVSIETRSVMSFEALVRWNRPGSGVVAASDFIGYAEARGLVNAIDACVLRDVCADAAKLLSHFPKATIAVNVSAANLTSPDLADSIDAALRAHALAPERLKLEITETAIMTNADQARITLDQLRRNGIQILVDDFGVGHSSLTYLHRLPIAGLKIDRSFIAALTTGEQAVAIVRSIVVLAQTLGLYTIAEGVETPEQLAILESLGVVYAQGFFFSPALSLADLLEFSVESTVYGA
jgi:diguanylate cyclase (GGDEF)-like protein